jgi:hypothetical protein
MCRTARSSVDAVAISSEKTNAMTSLPTGDPLVFRLSGISYLHIPAKDAQLSVVFYQAVFSWNVGGAEDHPSFEDGTGHVIGS